MSFLTFTTFEGSACKSSPSKLFYFVALKGSVHTTNKCRKIKKISLNSPCGFSFRWYPTGSYFLRKIGRGMLLTMLTNAICYTFRHLAAVPLSAERILSNFHNISHLCKCKWKHCPCNFFFSIPSLFMFQNLAIYEGLEIFGSSGPDILIYLIFSFNHGLKRLMSAS